MMRRASRLCWSPAVVVAVLVSVWGVAHANSYPAEVIELTDATFEHDTQASTGQTTGVWAVLFTDSTVARFDRASIVVEQLAQEEEKEVIYARASRCPHRYFPFNLRSNGGLGLCHGCLVLGPGAVRPRRAWEPCSPRRRLPVAVSLHLRRPF